MFPIAHAWLMDRTLPDNMHTLGSPASSDSSWPPLAAYLGCVWPDMLFGSPLTHTQSHRQGERLLDFARTLPAGAERDEFLVFVEGALSHCAEPHGFDWYSDEEYGGEPREARGYAFQRGRTLASDTAVACGLPEDQGWWKAHNIVEMAFERGLYAAEPDCGAKLSRACADEGLTERIAARVAQCFQVSQDGALESIRTFSSYVALQPSSVEALAEVYAKQTRSKHPSAQPNVSALADLISRAETLIAPDRIEYLAFCERMVGAMLRGMFANA